MKVVRRFQIRDLTSKYTSIGRWIGTADDIQRALPFLEAYLNDDTLPKGRDVRKRNIQSTIMEMIEAGGIVRGTPRYDTLNDFYKSNFGEDIPDYISEHVTLQRG